MSATTTPSLDEEALPPEVIADDADQVDVGAERGEVGGEIARAPGDGVRVRHGDGGDGSLAGDAGGSAVKVLVEQEVADDHDGQSTSGVKDCHQTLEGVLTVRVDCY